MRNKFFIPLLAISVLFVSCFEDMDDKLHTASTQDIQNFIYRGLNYYYLYKVDTPELANDAFASDGDRNNFLKGFDTPESLFDYLLSSQDRFSQLFSDYTVIENALGGVSLSDGMEYGLVYYPDKSRKVFGYVRYVLPSTDAQNQGLKRGDFFTTVDGVQIDENNYVELLSKMSYTIGLATFDGVTFQPTGQTATLNKMEYDENPIYLSRTFDFNGKKVGYLMYNSFIQRYDTDLNNIFGQLKSEGISDLVLDLRYNGGGSVQNATDLASMITGQFNGQVFYKEYWNEDRQAEQGKDGLFDNTISTGANINSLNLNRVYILTTQRTASASELVINGLNPYINTTQVGDTTTGKFQASFLMYDAPAPNFSRQQASPTHTYVMLPLVFKTANVAGKTDYVDGLFPQITLPENYFNLGQLGDPDEPLFAAALQEILSLPRTFPKAVPYLKEIAGSEKNSPLDGVMIGEPKE
ncbi:MAG TPA: S41 family peptidase [Aequorivita sp.]|nr:S41 family peptidase [Aequorivita sp.]